MKAQLLLCALVALVLSVFATDLYAQYPRFQSVVGDANSQQGYAIEQLSDSGYVIAGYTFRTGANSDAYLVRINRFGALVWAYSFDMGGNDTAYSVAVASDGGFVITGKTRNESGCTHDDIFLLKTNSSGVLQWVNVFGGGGDEAGNGVQRTSDNGYIITGRTNSFGAGQYDGFLLKTDINGALSWWYTYGDSGDDLFRSVHQTSDGGYVASGTTTSYGNGAQGYVVRVNSTGGLMWGRQFGGAQLEYMWAVRQTSDGGYITVGTEVSYTTTPDILMLKMDNTAAFAWARTYGFNSSWDEALSVKEACDNSLIVSGYVQGAGSGFGGVNAYMLKTNSFGNKTWSRAYGGAGTEMGWNVIQTLDGGFAFTGQTTSAAFGNNDVYVVKTEQNGLSSCRDTAIVELTTSQTITLNSVTPLRSRINMSCGINANRYSIGNDSVLCETHSWSGVVACAPAGLLLPSSTMQSDLMNEMPSRSMAMPKAGYDEASDNQFKIAPNPVQPGLTFSLLYNLEAPGSVTITVTDMLGRVVYHDVQNKLNGTGSLEIQTPGWSQGMYMVAVQSGTSSLMLPVVISE